MGLILLFAFTAVSVAGFATFGMHPAMLAGLDPSALEFYSVSFRFFAIGQVALAGLVMIAFLSRNAGLKWIPAFIALYLISLSSELLGTTFGIPFGAYSYSKALDPMWLSRVPVGIPLSWFYMSVPSYAIAGSILRGKSGATARIGLASFILLAWDLALDPAMSSATRYWEWAESGPYYGMPLLNLLGWYVTGVVLMTALSLLKAHSWTDKLSVRWLTGFYGANLFLGLGISIAAGLWLVPVFTVGALSIVFVVAGLFDTRRSSEIHSDPLLQLQ